MEITEQEKSILLDLFNRCHEQKKWVNAERFIIDHEDDIDIVKNLVKKNLIKIVTHIFILLFNDIVKLQISRLI